jgi:DNA-binding MarR family transcriptional regulator
MRPQAGSTLAGDEASGYRAALTGELVDEVMRFVRLLKASTASPAGLDMASLLLLWPLLHVGPMRLRDLAKAKGVDQSTASRQAAQLVKVGLVRRAPDPADRRACLLVLTDRGREVWREVADARSRGIAQALAGWDDDRIGEFAGLFRDFNHAVQQHVAANHPGDDSADDSTVATGQATGQATAAHHTPS